MSRSAHIESRVSLAVQVVLVNELGMCYAAIALVTDYDSWRDEDDVEHVSSWVAICTRSLKKSTFLYMYVELRHWPHWRNLTSRYFERPCATFSHLTPCEAHMYCLRRRNFPPSFWTAVNNVFVSPVSYNRHLSWQVSVEAVLKTFKDNAAKAVSLILGVIPKIAEIDWTRILDEKQVHVLLQFRWSFSTIWDLQCSICRRH